MINLLNTWNSLSGATRRAIVIGLITLTPAGGLTWKAIGFAFGFVNWGAAFLILLSLGAYKAVRIIADAANDRLEEELFEDEDVWF
jgi:hypothetical protein